MNAKVHKFTPDMIGKVVEISVAGTYSMGRLSSIQKGKDITFVTFSDTRSEYALRYNNDEIATIDAYDY